MILILPFLFLAYLLDKKLKNSIVFRISIFSIFCYWVTYPFEVLNIDNIYTPIIGIKDKGTTLFIIFSFAFLSGFFLFSKIKFRKIKIYKKINSINNLFFISFFLGLCGLLSFLYSFDFSITDYLNSVFNLTRINRLAMLSKSSNVLPYSIFFIPSIATLSIIYKKKDFVKTIYQKFLFLIITLINFPILASYLIEGDRTALIKAGAVIFVCLSLKEESNIKLKDGCAKKDLQYKKIFLKKLNQFLILFIVFFLLILIGNARGNGWKMVSKVPENFINQIKLGLLPTSEFRGVNFTVDWALSRDYLTLKKRKDMFTWNRMIFYPLPTYTYRSIFKKEKIPTISRVIGDEVKEYVFEDSIDKKLGYALSPIAEGYINFGTLGVLILGLFYGFCINFLQFQYNNISYKSINLFDILVLNSISIIPLIMRAGTAGIYNYIFSISFALFISLLSLIFFDKLRTLYVKKIK